jgi:hypothetical protein
LSTLLRRATACLAAGVIAGIGFVTTTAVADTFTDVPSTNFFAGDIDWLTTNHIANGFPDGTFDPQGAIKRQQAALWFNQYNAGFEVVTKEGTNNSVVGVITEVLTCPDGERALAGGGTASSGLFHATASVPSATGWHVTWTSVDLGNHPFGHWAMWAFCAPPDGTNHEIGPAASLD